MNDVHMHPHIIAFCILLALELRLYSVQ